MSSIAPAGEPLAGRCAVISGASRGLGLEIARHYVDAGASVMICARDQAALADAVAMLRAYARPGSRVAACSADISHARDAQRVVSEALQAFGRLDILVSNAGIVGPIGPAEELDWDAWMRTLQVNLFGSVHLCRAVLPHFKQTRRGKIIQLSGGGATKPLPMRSAYAASKAAVVRFMETLAAEVRGFGIEVNAIAPGALNTRMLNEALAAGPAACGAAAHAALLEQQRSGGVPLSKAAELAVFLGSSASDGISGRLLSAPWDRWDALPDHVRELAASDIYTLRRITPRDRDASWGED
jgi:NAD(P)-dependent dehydrogenase (short-subunit alcohol dehydrogenase family)